MFDNQYLNSLSPRPASVVEPLHSVLAGLKATGRIKLGSNHVSSSE